jgi:hypothetical protein
MKCDVDFVVKVSAIQHCSQAVSDVAVKGDHDQYEETQRVGHDWRQQTESWCTCSVVKMNVECVITR